MYRIPFKVWTFSTLCLIVSWATYAATDESRGYPSIFQAWNGIENKPNEDHLTRLARHDLVFSNPGLYGLRWQVSIEQPYKGLSSRLVQGNGEQSLARALQMRKKPLERNPHLKILCEVRYREGRYVSPKDAQPGHWGDYPPDASYWLRDREGQLAPGWGEDDDGDGTVELDEIRFMLIDFTQETFQDLLVAKVRALESSGLFDGIMLDWWNEDHATSGRWPNWSGTHLTREVETAGRIAILKKIRAVTREDFLILVNANARKVPLSAPYVNGLFMECYKRHHDRGYRAEDLKRMEETLRWAEEHLREPRINCLEGWRVVTDYDGGREIRIVERDSEENQRWMRLITTLSLTHSDGYVLFADDNAQPCPDHLHNWYDFWDTDLDRPLGPKGESYEGIDGLFLREFEKGWAVYNRSAAIQTVTFKTRMKAVHQRHTGTSFQIPPNDGELLLK